MTNHQLSKKTKVLVTGSSGFIGEHLINHLSKEQYEIIALQRRAEISPLVKYKCSRVIIGDICDPSIQQEAVKGVDSICHLAAYIPNNYNDLTKAEDCFKTNALATLGLASLAIGHGVKRFIYASAGNMYEYSDAPATEMTKIYPSDVACYYFISKLAGEVFLNHISQKTNMISISLRIGTPYGPGEPTNKVISSLMQKAQEGNVLDIYHGGTPKYNFVFVKDVAKCISLALESGNSGVYNIGSGEHSSLLDLGNIIANAYLPKKISLNIISSHTESPLGFRPISIQKAIDTWGFKPLTLFEGIQEFKEKYS